MARGLAIEGIKIAYLYTEDLEFGTKTTFPTDTSLSSQKILRPIKDKPSPEACLIDLLLPRIFVTRASR